LASDRRKIGTEVATVALVVACLLGTLNLVISLHRKALRAPKVAQAVPPPPPEPAPTPEPLPPPDPPRLADEPRPAPTPPPAPVEDPTPKALAELAESTARERAEAERLDREAEGLDSARKRADAEAESWRRREMLVKRQLATMDEKAQRATREVDAMASRRDVLAQERDALKAAIAAAPGEGSYAVLPYQGENGTWKRPIVIECTGGQVAIKPDGPTFTMLELSGLANPRSSPVVVALARELLKVQNSPSPDGAPVVPYFVFLVRPDGVRSYYEVRARLEPLGIAFGYELVAADMEIHVPNFDDVAAWDGSPSLGAAASGLASRSNGGGGGPGGDAPTGAWPSGGGGGGAGSTIGGGLGWPGGGGGEGKPGSGAGALAGGGLAWPGGSGGAGAGGGGEPRGTVGGFDLARGRSGGGAGTGSAGDGPNAFVWPSRRPGAGGGSFGGAGDSASDEGIAGALGTDGATRGGSSAGRDVGVGDYVGTGIAPATRDIARPDFARGGGLGIDRPGAGRGAVSRGLEPAPAGLGSEPDPGGGLTWGDSAPAGASPGAAWGYQAGRLSSGRPGDAGAANAGDSAGAPRNPSTESTGALGSPASASATSGAPGNPSTESTGTPGALSADSAVGGAGSATPAPASSLGALAGASGSLRGSGPGAASAASSSANAASANATGAGMKSSAMNPGSSGGGVPLPLPIEIGSPGGMQPPSLMLGNQSEDGKGKDQGQGNSGQGDGKGPRGRSKDWRRTPAIEAPFEIVVACDRDGVTIQPGNRRITAHALTDRREEELLTRNLEAEARRRAAVDPAIKPIPRVKFLVREDGAANFWEARRQLLFSGLDWPMTLQVAGAQNPRLFDDRGIW